MSPSSAFLTLFLSTLVLLAGAVFTGFRALRRVHIPLVVATVLSLAATIWFAELLGRDYDLDATGRIKPIHLFLAKLTTLAYLAPITTGLLTIRRPAVRIWHRRVVFTVLGLTIVTVVTGTWMILAAEPL